MECEDTMDYGEKDIYALGRGNKKCVVELGVQVSFVKGMHGFGYGAFCFGLNYASHSTTLLHTRREICALIHVFRV